MAAAFPKGVIFTEKDLPRIPSELNLERMDENGVPGTEVETLVGKKFVHFQSQEKYKVLRTVWMADTAEWGVMLSASDTPLTVMMSYQSFVRPVKMPRFAPID